jgi:hypothetical protein
MTMLVTVAHVLPRTAIQKANVRIVGPDMSRDDFKSD